MSKKVKLVECCDCGELFPEAHFVDPSDKYRTCQNCEDRMSCENDDYYLNLGNPYTF